MGRSLCHAIKKLGIFLSWQGQFTPGVSPGEANRSFHVEQVSKTSVTTDKTLSSGKENIIQNEKTKSLKHVHSNKQKIVYDVCFVQNYIYI